MAIFKIRATVEVDEDKFRAAFEYADIGPGGLAGWVAYKVEDALESAVFWGEAVTSVNAEAMEVIQ